MASGGAVRPVRVRRPERSDEDCNWNVGTSFGIDRVIWTCGDFGVEVGFNFAFFLKDDWFKGSSGGYVRKDTYTDGSYLTDVNMGNAEVMNDPWPQNPEGPMAQGLTAVQGRSSVSMKSPSRTPHENNAHCVNSRLTNVFYNDGVSIRQKERRC